MLTLSLGLFSQGLRMFRSSLPFLMKSLYAAITWLPLLSFLTGALKESALLIKSISCIAAARISWSVLTALLGMVSSSATAALSMALARVLCVFAGGDEAASLFDSCEAEPCSAPACSHLGRHNPNAVCRKLSADLPSPESLLPTCQLVRSPRHAQSSN